MLVLMEFQCKSSKLPSGSHLVLHQPIPLASLDAKCWKCRNLEVQAERSWNQPTVNFRSLTDLKRGISVSAELKHLDTIQRKCFSVIMPHPSSRTSQKEEVLQKTRIYEWHLMKLPWQALSWHRSRWNTCYVKQTKKNPVNFILVQRCL